MDYIDFHNYCKSRLEIRPFCFFFEFFWIKRKKENEFILKEKLILFSFGFWIF